MVGADFDDVPKTMAFSSAGKVSLRRDFALPFLTAVNEDLAQNGFHDLDADVGYEYLDENFTIAPSFFSPQSSSPTAVFGADDLAIGIFIFIGAALGEWAVERVADGVFGRRIKPHLSILRSTRDGTDNPPTTKVPLNVDFWFDGSKMGVSIKTELSETNDEAVHTIVREAMAAAAAWSVRNDVDGKRLSFEHEGGKPTVSTVDDL